MMARAAILTIAGGEWRRRWRSLVLLGVAAGLFCGLVLSAAALARRTSSAPERLFAATSLGDAQVRLFAGDTLADRIEELPMVERSLRAGVTVGRLEDFGSVQYVGVAVPSVASGLVTPVVLEGRAAAPERPDEVVVTEDLAERVGLEVGSTLTVAMLTAEEVFQFDTGFGEPDGPRLELTVTGIVRVPPGVFDGMPVIATPAFDAGYQDLYAGIDVFVDLRDGPDALAGFEAAVDALVAEAAPEDAEEDFSPLTVSAPRAATELLIRSSHVLVGGLLVAAIAAGIAVVLALAQAWTRHHSASAAEQRVERALGLTTVERVIARTLPALATSAIAGAAAIAVVVVTAGIDPPGAMRRIEPHPGRRVDVPVAALGVIGVVLVVVLTAAWTVWLSGRATGGAIDVASTRSGSRRSSRGRAPASTLIPRRHGWPLAGTVFALFSHGRGASAPMRTSIVAMVIGVGGVVGAATFDASLDRLTSTPLRYGWDGDLVVVDVSDEVVAGLLADDRFVAVGDVSSGTVSLGGMDVNAYTLEPLRGSLTWDLADGRLAAAPDEVVVGARLADRIDARVGDTIEIGERAMTVAGIGIGPAFGGETLGVSVLLTPAGFEAVAPIGNFREALLRLAPGVDLAAVAAELGVQYELTVRELPLEVRNIDDLGRLPGVLGGFLVALAVVALVHSLTVTVRSRAHDLAVMGALGATRRQVRSTVVSMSVVTALIGVVVGVPLGWSIGRLVWGGLATSIGVRSDVTTPWVVLAVAVLVPVGAALIALAPAYRVGRLDPGRVLRAE